MMPNEMSSPQPMNYAGFWIRFVAYLIDLVVVTIPGMLIISAGLPSLLNLILGLA